MPLKRPLNELMTAVNNSGIKFLVMTAREADEYEEHERPGMRKKELVKIGQKPDAVRGIEYEVNVSLHFLKTEHGWAYSVQKVQGGLARIFPQDGSGKSFPASELFAYASRLKAAPANLDAPSDDAIAERIAQAEEEKSLPKNPSGLTQYAASLGFYREQMKDILLSAGFGGFKAENWEGMKLAFTEVATKQTIVSGNGIRPTAA
ncbi:MAG TPA: hypothetical protein VFF68_14430 [Anaerolineaceae bacterium]|nr:hypothetical protein [Anaerolineaceae bacterium]